MTSIDLKKKKMTHVCVFAEYEHELVGSLRHSSAVLAVDGGRAPQGWQGTLALLLLCPRPAAPSSLRPAFCVLFRGNALQLRERPGLHPGPPSTRPPHLLAPLHSGTDLGLTLSDRCPSAWRPSVLPWPAERAHPLQATTRPPGRSQHIPRTQWGIGCCKETVEGASGRQDSPKVRHKG